MKSVRNKGTRCKHTHQDVETKCVSLRGCHAQCRSARQERISVRAHIVLMDEGRYNKVEKLTCRSPLHRRRLLRGGAPLSLEGLPQQLPRTCPFRSVYEVNLSPASSPALHKRRSKWPRLMKVLENKLKINTAEMNRHARALIQKINTGSCMQQTTT